MNEIQQIKFTGWPRFTDTRLTPDLILGRGIGAFIMRLLARLFHSKVYLESLSHYQVTLHSQEILEHIQTSRENLLLIFDEKVDTLLMGPRDEHELLGVVAAGVDLKLENAGVTKLVGLRVVVVPWMEGWVLLDSKTLEGGGAL